MKFLPERVILFLARWRGIINSRILELNLQAGNLRRRRALGTSAIDGALVRPGRRVPRARIRRVRVRRRRPRRRRRVRDDFRSRVRDGRRRDRRRDGARRRGETEPAEGSVHDVHLRQVRHAGGERVLAPGVRQRRRHRSVPRMPGPALSRGPIRVVRRARERGGLPARKRGNRRARQGIRGRGERGRDVGVRRSSAQRVEGEGERADAFGIVLRLGRYT